MKNNPVKDTVTAAEAEVAGSAGSAGSAEAESSPQPSEGGVPGDIGADSQGSAYASEVSAIRDDATQLLLAINSNRAASRAELHDHLLAAVKLIHRLTEVV